MQLLHCLLDRLGRGPVAAASVGHHDEHALAPPAAAAAACGMAGKGVWVCGWMGGWVTRGAGCTGCANLHSICWTAEDVHTKSRCISKDCIKHGLVVGCRHWLQCRAPAGCAIHHSLLLFLWKGHSRRLHASDGPHPCRAEGCLQLVAAWERAHEHLETKTGAHHVGGSSNAESNWA
jgi:hypothetical protein